MYPKFNVNTNQINKVLKEIGQRVDKVAFDRLQAAAEVGRAVAQEGFDNAIYDGVPDVTVFVDSSMHSRTVEIIASGSAAKFIEYGTGLQGGKKPGYKNPTTGKDYWYFSAKGGQPMLNAGGEHAENSYWRTTEDVETFIYEYQKGVHSYRVSEDDVRMGKGGMYYMDDAGQRYSVMETIDEEGEREKVDPYKVYGDPPYKENSFITHGNPPNHIMRHVAHEVVRQFYEAYKSPYDKSR